MTLQTLIFWLPGTAEDFESHRAQSRNKAPSRAKDLCPGAIEGDAEPRLQSIHGKNKPEPINWNITWNSPRSHHHSKHKDPLPLQSQGADERPKDVFFRRRSAHTL